MKGTTGRLLLFIVFLGMMGGVFVWKNAGMSEADRTVRQGLPRMVQVSSPTCPPCLMMVPALNGLKKDYQGRVNIQVIDLSEEPEEGRKNNIRATPTQIFYNAQGEEVYRHEGYMSREEILQVFEEELGVG